MIMNIAFKLFILKIFQTLIRDTLINHFFLTMNFSTIYILSNHQTESENIIQLSGYIFNNHFDKMTQMIDHRISYE